MIEIQKLLRKNIRELKPYNCARNEHLQNDYIYLDANENAFVAETEPKLNRYPDPFQWQLRTKIAEIKGIKPEQIFLGNGSDEAIDLLIRAFCQPQQEKIMVLPPTYGMYEVCAAVNDVGVTEIILDPNFDIDLDKVLPAINPNSKLIFLCSPNNPTGNCLNEKAIEKILKQFHGLVVLDEAYIDMSSKQSWLLRLNQFENLVILQTFSKVWGLANIRLGMAFASPEIIQILNKIKFPYNISGISQSLAFSALSNQGKKDEMVQQMIQQRAWLTEQLKALPIVDNVFPSEANFLLVMVRSAQDVYQYLLSQGIIVRDRSSLPRCRNCLRITVGDSETNLKLIEILKNYNG